MNEAHGTSVEEATSADVPLFPDYTPEVVEPYEALSPERRRTVRQAKLISMGLHPLTGKPLHPEADSARTAASPPAPFTCGACIHRQPHQYGNKRVAKCTYGADLLEAPRVSNSVATDVRAWWPSCRDHEPRPAT